MKTSQSKCLIDWGSSNFRAWIVNSDGRLIEEYQYPVGILDPAVENKTTWFESLIEELSFDYPNLDFLAVGMIGSATGIKNTKYLSSPCNLENWATNSESYLTSTGKSIEIFPGLIANSANPQLVDMIRGEEFQIFTSNHADSKNLFVCPGTHSKWISTSSFEILNIQTFTTGELFESLVTKSSISQLMSSEVTENGFLHGLTIATTSKALTNSIFKLRAQFLSGYLSVEDLKGAASGLLIGTEFVHAIEEYGKQKSVVLVGSKANCETYQRACDFFGITAIIDETTIEQRVARLVEIRSRLTERVNS
jgi:2-dehydro-3-deoxygalactonokinase